MIKQSLPRLAWAAAGLAVLSALLALALYGFNLRQVAMPEDARIGPLNLVMALTFPPAGLLILRAHPRHAVGWIFLGIGLSQGVGIFVAQYAFAALELAGSPLPLGELAFWLQTYFWVPGFTLLLLLMAVFPNGQIESRGGRWVMTIVAAAGGLALLSMVEPLTDPAPVGFINLPPDPLGVGDLLLDLAVFMLLAGTAAAVWHLARRLRRSSGVERQQLKYFAFAGVVFGLTFLILSALSIWQVLDPTIAESAAYRLGLGTARILFPLSAALIPLAVGAAVLRYRLYGIDVIIRRTLIYSALTFTLAGVYAVGVMLLQALLFGITRQDRTEIAVVISTLAIAALFSPLRGWIQSVIDRRFFRQRYDAEQSLAAFSAGLRQEVDLNQIVARTEQVVHETLQPETAFVWLVPASHQPPDSQA